MQKNLDISIINYKFFSGRYIIYESNGFGKEYNGFIEEDSLIFEGEYLNGKRNGKGMEYGYNGNLIFEGEYVNGKRNGKGKEYGNYGKIKFEGEYLNGNRLIGIEYEKDGKNFKKINNEKELYKKYNKNNTLKIQNNYINGLIKGKGKEYYKNNKIRFDGEYLFSKKWNEKDNTKDENIYELYKNYEDIIILNYEYFSYELEGQNSYGVIKGKIKGLYYNDKILINNEYLYAKKIGKGKFYNIDGNLEFEGEYLYNHKRKGKEYYKDGNLRFEENIYLIRNGVGKDMIWKEIKYMN